MVHLNEQVKIIMFRIGLLVELEEKGLLEELKTDYLVGVMVWLNFFA